MNDDRKGCKARRQQDEMHCARCGLTWSLDDKDPPACVSGNKPLPSTRNTGK